MYFVAKPGTHYPDLFTITTMRSRLPAIRNSINQTGSTTLCADDLDALNYWEPSMDMGVADQLARFGHDELKAIGRFTIKWKHAM